MLELYGADYSVYVRAVRIALEEKRAPYKLIPVDIFSPEKIPLDYNNLHPFMKIPVLKNGDFILYETTAILGYVDDILPGTALQPSRPELRARMAQIQSILNTYAYKTLVWGVYVERIVNAREGRPVDDKKISAALQEGRTILDSLEALTADAGPFLLGTGPSLADCLAIPMFYLIQKAPEGRDLIANFPRLEDWSAAMTKRPSFQKTNPGSRNDNAH